MESIPNNVNSIPLLSQVSLESWLFIGGGKSSSSPTFWSLTTPIPLRVRMTHQAAAIVLPFLRWTSVVGHRLGLCLGLVGIVKGPGATHSCAKYHTKLLPRNPTQPPPTEHWNAKSRAF